MQTDKWLAPQNETVIHTSFYSVNFIAENGTEEIVLDGKLEQV